MASVCRMAVSPNSFTIHMTVYRIISVEYSSVNKGKQSMLIYVNQY